MLKNYTPHEVVLCGRVYSSEGIARCAVSSTVIGDVDGIPVNAKAYEEVVGLPEPEEGTYFIVSTLVAQAVKGKRDDCLVPDELLRDEQGRIVGANALARV